MNDRGAHDFSAAFDLFLLDCEARRLTPGTRQFYIAKLSLLIRWREAQGIHTVQQLTAHDLRRYLVHLSRRQLSSQYQHNLARAIRAFLNYYVRDELTASSPVDRVQMPKLPTALTLAEIRAILRQCSSERDRALCLFLLNTGLHTSAVIAFNVGDIDLKRDVVPVLVKEGPPEENPWGINFLRMFDMTNDSHLFQTIEELENNGWELQGNKFVRGRDVCLPMWEDWMIHLFEHRYQSNGGIETTLSQHQNPNFVVTPRYWVKEGLVRSTSGKSFNDGFLIVFRNRTRSTDSRTVICAVIPISAAGNTIPVIQVEKHRFRSLVHLNLSSFVFDYVTCQKIGGLNLNFFIVKQLPLLPSSRYSDRCSWSQGTEGIDITNAEWLMPRGLELTYTAWDLQPFARDCGYDGPPFRWDEERRFLLRCELDAAYFHLYGIERDDVDYIMDTFPIVKRKDMAAYGEYRTKRVILEIYDEMAEAIRTHVPYQTRLDPPPADPRLAHPPKGAAKSPDDLWYLGDVARFSIPDRPFTLELTADEAPHRQPGRYGCTPLADDAPAPGEGALVLVRHPNLRRGDHTITAAAGTWHVQELIDATTHQRIYRVFLRAMTPPAELRLTLDEWATFRPAGILTRLDA